MYNVHMDFENSCLKQPEQQLECYKTAQYITFKQEEWHKTWMHQWNSLILVWPRNDKPESCKVPWNVYTPQNFIGAFMSYVILCVWMLYTCIEQFCNISAVVLVVWDKNFQYLSTDLADHNNYTWIHFGTRKALTLGYTVGYNTMLHVTFYSRTTIILWNGNSCFVPCFKKQVYHKGQNFVGFKISGVSWI